MIKDINDLEKCIITFEHVQESSLAATKSDVQEQSKTINHLANLSNNQHQQIDELEIYNGLTEKAMAMPDPSLPVDSSLSSGSVPRILQINFKQ